jgi:hypothetical protein
MTRLASITNNHLSLTCSVCGHSALLPVTTAIEVFGREAPVQHVVKRARCSRCKAKGAVSLQIVYVGGSGEAMLGAQVRNLKNL